MSHIISDLEQLRQTDLQIANGLAALLAERNDLYDAHLSHLARNGSVLISSSEKQSDALKTKIDDADRLGTAMSVKVRHLDCAQSRLRLALEQIDLILDLKVAIESSRAALEKGDFEVAAKHIGRMLRQYRKTRAAERDAFDADISEDDDVSFSVLIDLESRLRKDILKKLELSIDDNEIMRYCRLLAHVGMAFEGLTKCCELLRKRLDRRSLEPASASSSYLERISVVFDIVSECVRDNEKSLQQDFGIGSHLCLVQEMQRLVDARVAPILRNFQSDKQLNKLASRVRSYTSQFKDEATPIIDALDLDRVLEEVATLTRECELFDLDLRAAGTQASDALKDNSSDLFEVIQSQKNSNGVSLLAVSELNRIVQEILGHYISLENYYMLVNVGKAMRSAELSRNTVQTPAPSAPALPGVIISDFVDDVFYIIKTSGSRALSIHSIPSAVAVLNNINSFLDGPYKNAIVERIQVTQIGLDSAATAFFSHPTEHENAILSELAALNDADVSAQNVVLLKEFFENEHKKVAISNTFNALADQCFLEMNQTARLLRKICSQGVNRHTKLIFSNIAPFCNKFEQCNYELSEAEYENNPDPYVHQLIQACSNALAEIKAKVTEGVLDSIVIHLASYIAHRIASLCFNKTFSFNGGLQVDKDVRHLVAFFSQNCTKSVRDKFLRLSQIASVLQLYEISELNELQMDTSDSAGWELSPQDIKNLLKRRTEFSPEQIESLPL